MNRQIRYQVILGSVISISFILLSLFATTSFALDKPSGFMPRLSVSPGNLRSCQAREDAIKKRMSRLLDLVTNMESKFDKHAQRVEDFYTSKIVPSGRIVANYNDLVSDIQIKKTAVQTVLNKAQNDVNSFNCNSGNPKEQMKTFREDMRKVKRALKDYRTSIKNLIVAVRSVVGETERNSTPKPTQ